MSYLRFATKYVPKRVDLTQITGHLTPYTRRSKRTDRREILRLRGAYR